MIFRISLYHKKDTNYSSTYTDIPGNYFRDIITNGNSCEKAKNYLKDYGIIECDELSSAINGKSKGYKFNDALLSKLVIVKLSKETLVKNIFRNKNERNNFVNDTLKPARDHFLNTFDIDYEAAAKYIEQQYAKAIRNTDSSNTTGIIKALNRYNSHFMSINAIKDRDLFFKKNKTNGRVDTNLTNLKSELKQFITTKELTQIDITNSQPYLLSLMLKDAHNDELDIEELAKYSELTSTGQFYEYMMYKFYRQEVNTMTQNEFKVKRKKIKEMMFCIYYSKNESFRQEKRIFLEEFPSIMRWIEVQKIDEHNQLAIKMQKAESKICVDIITAELNAAGIKYFTIHDAWLVGDNDVERTTNIIKDCFMVKYNGHPTFVTEKVN
jgi:hypothetical protein